MSDATFEDAFNLLCGKQLGSGIHRDVFECRVRPDLVVKVENSEQGQWRNFANVQEHAFWADHQYAASVSKWLAPCEYLSPDGRNSHTRASSFPVPVPPLPVDPHMVLGGPYLPRQGHGARTAERHAHPRTTE